jgi:hypothetical protein
MSKALRVALVALFVPVAACAGVTERTETTETTTPSAPGAPAAMPPETHAPELARVTTGTGTTVAFFEAAPGQVLVLESGPVAAVSALTADNQALPLSALYREISGARDVPGALLAAELREAEVQANLPLDTKSAQRSRAEASRATRPAIAHAPPSIPPSSTLAAGGSCSASTFTSKGGCVGGGNKEWCLLDWWNGAWEAASSTDLSEAFACADLGSFLFHAATGNGSVVDWSVLQGQWAHYMFHYGPQTSLRYEIRNASGSRFQFGGTFYWY